MVGNFSKYITYSNIAKYMVKSRFPGEKNGSFGSDSTENLFKVIIKKVH